MYLSKILLVLNEVFMKYNFVICVDNSEYEASLDIWKVYETIKDEKSERHNLIRIIDDSGEDYLYPSNFFKNISLPEPIQEAYLNYKQNYV